jgi:tetratricopeptide (TPR) repeat protein
MQNAPASVPDTAAAQFALGQKYLHEKDPAHAIECIDAALALEPNRADYWNDRAIAALMLRDLSGAASFFREAVRCAPNNARFHCNLGNVARDAGQRDDAMQHFKRALELDPALLEAHVAAGELARETGRADEAVEIFERALQRAPDSIPVMLGLAESLNAARRHDDAVEAYRRVLQREPDNAQGRFGIGVCYGAQLRFEDALSAYRHALAVAPDIFAIHNNMGFMLTCLSRYDEAETHLRRAIELKPDLPDANKQLGMNELRAGRYCEGWARYEFRKAGGESGGYFSYAMPEWQGEPLDGKRILLTREQGVGDQLQFIRYADVLRERGATVDMWTNPELVSLFSRANGVHRAMHARPWDGYDYHCPVMSVPYRLRAEVVPATVPYLHADTAQADAWRDRLKATAGSRRKIGLVWAGNPSHLLDRFRSIPLDALRPLASIPGIAWFALQKGPGAAQLDRNADHFPDWPMEALGPSLNDFDATAAAIAALDIVLTVDTSVAHLAGALGKPVWVMLAEQSDWRWGFAQDSVWYPTARLFRQTTLGDWSAVVEAIGDALRSS